ncbi:MAG: hypothetical protein FWD98_08165 [Defluviitaleaceae bacterium]|nr:hypothetical protein [Defluviitaleaceae bacterium]
MKKQFRRPRGLFSKKLISFAAAVYAATWLVAAVSWALVREVPQELMMYTTWMFGSALTVYGGKSAYENGCKINAGRGDGV